MLDQLKGCIPWGVSVPEETLAALNRLAAARGVSRSRLIRECLTAGLETWRRSER